MTNTTKPELKPCPFCQCSVEINDPRPERSSNFINIVASHKVGCPMHHATNGYAVKGPAFDHIAENWNTRAPQWQDISTAPKDGSIFEAWYVSLRGPSFGPMQWHGTSPDDKKGRFHSWATLTEAKFATHWRHSPEPPSDV